MPVAPSPNHINQAHIPHPVKLTHFIIILIPTPTSPKWPPSSRFLDKTVHPPHQCVLHAPPISSFICYSYQRWMKRKDNYVHHYATLFVVVIFVVVVSKYVNFATRRNQQTFMLKKREILRNFEGLSDLLSLIWRGDFVSHHKIQLHG